MRASRWPLASLGVLHGGVDGRAGGVRSTQVGQQRAHVQGVCVPDEDLTEDRGVGGKQYAMPGRGGGEEREDVRGPRRGGEHDVGRVPGGAGPQDGGLLWGAKWRDGGGAGLGRCCGAVCGAGCWAAWGRAAGGGGGRAVAWEGARWRSDAIDVCVVLRVERSPR